MEAAAGEKAHTEGTGLPLHRGSQEASMRGSKSWRVASMPSLCFSWFGLFYRTNEGDRGSCITMREYNVETSIEVVHRWLFAPHGGGRRRKGSHRRNGAASSSRLPGSLYAWFKKLEGCLCALLVFPMFRFVLQRTNEGNRGCNGDRGFCMI